MPISIQRCSVELILGLIFQLFLFSSIYCSRWYYLRNLLFFFSSFLIIFFTCHRSRGSNNRLNLRVETSLTKSSPDRIPMNVGKSVFDGKIGICKKISRLINLVKSKPNPTHKLKAEASFQSWTFFFLIPLKSRLFNSVFPQIFDHFCFADFLLFFKVIVDFILLVK